MERMHKPYPIGIENFEEIISGGYLYVDKTEYLHQLISAGKYYLLCRPRRFGKSLFMSTAEAFFEGKRKLFEGLAIARHDYDWKPSPVFHLSLINVKSADPALLEAALVYQFEKWESIYQVKNSPAPLGLRFEHIITTACERSGRKVVILIDEYDKPLMSETDDYDAKDAVRDILKPVYSNLKKCDRYIRFALLTGVSRFSRLSIFSDLNNLNDISFDDDMAAVCGISEEELLQYCCYGIRELAEKNRESVEWGVAKLKENYDGYHFTEESPDIYNPFSLLSALQKKKIGDYWFITGTPSYLMKAIVSKNIDLHGLLNSEADTATLSQIDSYSDDPVPMLFQTGYLTIKGIDEDSGDFILGIPNKEVERGFFHGLLPLCSGQSAMASRDFIREAAKLLREGNPEKFLEKLRAFLADIPYELANKQPEIYFENNLYVIFKLLGFNVKAEYHTSSGRIDVVVKTSKYVYVMELKLNGSSEEAMRQIDGKGYSVPFSADGRRVMKIGVNFSSETRTLADWLIE